MPLAHDSSEMDVDPNPKRTVKSTITTTTIERQENGEAKLKRKKTEKPKEKERAPPSDVTLYDFGGIDETLDTLKNSISFPFYLATSGHFKKVHITRGILLHGPPGCGKTSLVGAYAHHLGVSYIPVSAPTVVAGMSGESEKKIREVFEEARRLAPCLVFFDEIDVIMGKRETAQREMEKRMVAQMGTSMDEIASMPPDKVVLVFAATNRPDQMDESLRRGGRFELEISMGMPDERAREAILRRLLNDEELSVGVDFGRLAKLTPGFVGADLKAMVGNASQIRGRRLVEEQLVKARLSLPDFDYRDRPSIDEYRLLCVYDDFKKQNPTGHEPIAEHSSISFGDFKQAISQVQPMAKREGFSSIPNTTWDNVGAMEEIRKQMEEAIVGPIQCPELYEKIGRKTPSGVLLWGPPGCGKTLLAKAVANEVQVNFISIKGPELLNKYVGESERAVRQLFARARQSQPCILFFDELDSLVPNRDDAMNDSSHRLVNAMLTELDGVEDRKGVYVIAATNRPDRIDQAILRPGRLGTLVFVDLPTAAERVDILRAIVRNALGERATENVLSPLEDICRDKAAEGLSGADLQSLFERAGSHCLQRCRRSGDTDAIFLCEDWEYALKNVRASVTDPDHFRITLKVALERRAQA